MQVLVSKNSWSLVRKNNLVSIIVCWGVYFQQFSKLHLQLKVLTSICRPTLTVTKKTNLERNTNPNTNSTTYRNV